MKLEELKKLVAAGESKTVEFKKQAFSPESLCCPWPSPF